MRKKKAAVVVTAPKEKARGIEDQMNAMEQERIRVAVSELLIRSRAEVRQDVISVTERNRSRIERIRSGMNIVPEAEQMALLAVMHADLEKLLAVYWFFITATSFPKQATPSVHDPVVVEEAMQPLSELLFE